MLIFYLLYILPSVHILPFPNSNSRCTSTAATSSSISSSACSTSTKSCTTAATNTTAICQYSPLIPQCSPSTQIIWCNVHENDSVKDLSEGMSFANFACELSGYHCIPLKLREKGRKDTEEWKCDRGDHSNGINENRTNQKNGEYTYQYH